MYVYTNCVIRLWKNIIKKGKKHIQIKTIEIKNKTLDSKTQAIKAPVQVIIMSRIKRCMQR